MDRVAVFVDAGYLLSAGARLLGLTGRGDVQIDVTKATTAIVKWARIMTGLPLLRVYWYDGADSGPSAQHLELMRTDDVRVRLGRVNRFGEQKGVDSLLVADIITLAQNRAMASAVLITGDEDMLVAVNIAMGMGVRVHLLGVGENTVSNNLAAEVDRVHLWGKQDVETFLSEKVDVNIDISGLNFDQAAQRVVAHVVDRLSGRDRDRLASDYQGGEWRVPREIDRVLLLALGSYEMGDQEKHQVRAMFRERVSLSPEGVQEDLMWEAGLLK